MEKKQTAVEWLAERCGLQALEDVIAEAKEMEENQIVDAYANGQADTLLMLKERIGKMTDIPTDFNQLISENFWDLI
jgi:hypothetical protein